MALFYKIFFTVVLLIGFVTAANCQLTVSGTVYDSTRTVPVKDVFIKSSNGTSASTDSNGRYTIVTTDKDSLTFIYQNKPTAKFAVRQIPNISSFDISLHIRVAEKFKTLKEVKVYAKNYRQDSIQNREAYAKIFTYQKPGITLTSDAYTGAAGADLNELINVFRFRRNRQLKKMQLRLMEQEEENYINYRFNKTTVRRITRLEGAELDEFMKAYRPGFEFTQQSSVVEFYQYILNASYTYKLNKEKETFISYRFNTATVKMITSLEGSDLDIFMKKYRPGYEFALNSGTEEFYQYIVNAYSQFKSQQHGLQIPDSLHKH